MTKALVFFCFVLLAIPSIAQSPQHENNCSPSGVWYSEPYVLTIIPTGEKEFSIRYEPVYDVTTYGYKAWTSWPGQLARIRGNRYRSQAISMFTTTSDTLELDGVRGWMEFTSCNSIKITYDFFGGYFDLNKVPFVDPPDVNYLPSGGLIETYRRMPTKCPACNLSAAPRKLGQRH
jgi:hypothetical protein